MTERVTHGGRGQLSEGSYQQRVLGTIERLQLGKHWRKRHGQRLQAVVVHVEVAHGGPAARVVQELLQCIRAEIQPR